MQNLIENIRNYSDTTVRLFFPKDEANDFNADIANIDVLNLSSIKLNY